MIGTIALILGGYLINNMFLIGYWFWGNATFLGYDKDKIIGDWMEKYIYIIAPIGFTCLFIPFAVALFLVILHISGVIVLRNTLFHQKENK